MATLKDYFDAWGENVPSKQSDLADTARWIRLSALKESDWTQMPDSPLTDEQKVLWGNYRQQLRDLSFTKINADTFVFPDKPL